MGHILEQQTAAHHQRKDNQSASPATVRKSPVVQQIFGGYTQGNFKSIANRL